VREFPITRPKRDPNAFHGPYPKPGQTVMFCPVDRRHCLFSFAPDGQLVCDSCGLVLTRAEVTGQGRPYRACRPC
jgi:hypothetical protein